MRLLLTLAVFLGAIAIVCVLLTSQQLPKPAQIECSHDYDCFKGGCSGQVCSSKPNVVTTCEYADYYSCFNLTTCGCVNGKCQWKSNQQFDACIAEKAPKMR